MEISNYLEKKSENLEVKHIYSGKFHIFEVLSDKKKYEVAFKVSCTCEYGSLWGKPRSKPCKHIVAVLKKILKNEK
jgi:predicted nucleic acid-binding Zn finger protein